MSAGVPLSGEKEPIDKSGACRSCKGLLFHAGGCPDEGLSAEDEFLLTYGEPAYRAALGLCAVCGKAPRSEGGPMCTKCRYSL